MINLKNEEDYDDINLLPKNVRQIGEIKSGPRIYMEDYVYTYLHQFAIQNRKEEQIAFLIGKYCRSTDDTILLIHGAIQGKFTKKEHGCLQITEETLEYVEEIRKDFFGEDEIQGWVYTQPGYGVLLTSFLEKQHKEFFSEENQVLFLLDPIEKEEGFFAYEDEALQQKPGFFIYYDKNEAMHEYMLEHKLSESDFIEPKMDEAVRSFRMKDQAKKEEFNHRRLVNMLFVLSGALMIICFIIGAGLMSNMEETSKLKNSFATVMEEYGVLKSGLSGDIKAQVEDLEDSLRSVPAGSVIIEGPVGEEGEATEETGDKDQAEELVENEEPPATETVQILQKPIEYTVKSGDNLIKISYEFYDTKEMVPKIQEINGIDNPHKIYVGQTLLLP